MKSGVGAGLIVSETVVSLVSPPPVPRSVMVKVPVCVEPLVTSVNVEFVVPLASGDADAGFQAVPCATYPGGRFKAKKLTELSKPFRLCTVSVKVVVAPCVIVREDGDALTVKSGVGAGLIVSETVVSLVSPPPVARSVIVKVPVWVEPLVTKVNVELVDPFAGGVAEAGFQAVPCAT